MKIAITTSGQDMDAQIDPRFGRAQAFIIFDTESGDWQLLANSVNLNAVQSLKLIKPRNSYVFEFAVGFAHHNALALFDRSALNSANADSANIIIVFKR